MLAEYQKLNDLASCYGCTQLDRASHLQTTGHLIKKASFKHYKRWVIAVVLILLGASLSLILIDALRINGNSILSVSIVPERLNFSEDFRTPAIPGSRIGMHTMMYGKGSRHSNKDQRPFQDLYVPTLRRMVQYAILQGYPFTFSAHTFLHNLRENGKSYNWSEQWSKQAVTLTLILEELQKPEQDRLEWICFFDADVLFTNLRLPLDLFLPSTEIMKSDNIFLVIAQDRWEVINSGAYFMRVCEESVLFLTAHQASPVFYPNLKWTSGQQTGMSLVAALDQFASKVAIVPQKWINNDYLGVSQNKTSRDRFMPGDLLVHFMTHNKNGWRELLQHCTAANDPYGYNRYISKSKAQEIEDFWISWHSQSRNEKVALVHAAAKKAMLREGVEQKLYTDVLYNSTL